MARAPRSQPPPSSTKRRPRHMHTAGHAPRRRQARLCCRLNSLLSAGDAYSHAHLGKEEFFNPLYGVRSYKQFYPTSVSVPGEHAQTAVNQMCPNEAHLCQTTSCSHHHGYIPSKWHKGTCNSPGPKMPQLFRSLVSKTSVAGLQFHALLLG